MNKLMYLLMIIITFSCISCSGSSDPQSFSYEEKKVIAALGLSMWISEMDKVSEKIGTPESWADELMWKKYETINLVLPHTISTSLEVERLAMAAMGKTQEPEVIKLHSKITKLLVGHPKTLEEMGTGKPIKLFLTHINGCPEDRFAYVYPADHPEALKPIFYIDLGGKPYPSCNE